MIDIVHSSWSASGWRNHLLPSVSKKCYHWRHTRFRQKHVVSLCVLPPVRAFRRFSEPSQRPKNRSEELNSAVGRSGGVGVGLGSQCNGSRFVNYDLRRSICLSCTPFFRLSLLTFVNRYFPVISHTVSWAFSCSLKLGFSCLLTYWPVCLFVTYYKTKLTRLHFLGKHILFTGWPILYCNNFKLWGILSLIYIFKMDVVLFVYLFVWPEFLQNYWTDLHAVFWQIILIFPRSFINIYKLILN